MVHPGEFSVNFIRLFLKFLWVKGRSFLDVGVQMGWGMVFLGSGSVVEESASPLCVSRLLPIVPNVLMVPSMKYACVLGSPAFCRRVEVTVSWWCLEKMVFIPVTYWSIPCATMPYPRLENSP